MSRSYASIVTTLSLPALLLLLLNLTLTLHSADPIRSRPIGEETELKLRSNSTSLALLSVKEDVQEVKRRDPAQPITAPVNATAEERINWFKANVQSFDVLKQSKLSRQFKNRVEEFFNGGGTGACQARFFMTWIAPAKSFGRRELVAVETLFHAHPNGCLLILSTAMDSEQGRLLLKPLADLGYRVLAAAPDIPYLASGTPAAAWYTELLNGEVDPGEVPLAQNLSNLLRLLVLHRYGGVYLDADVVVMKKLTGLNNTIGAQAADSGTGRWLRLNNAVLIFDKHHPVLYKFIEEFSASFNGSKWGHNGPYLVTRVVRRMAGRAGHGLAVLPPSAFYPADWNRIGGLFRRPESPATARWATAKLAQLAGESYTVHLWNKRSRSLEIEEGSVMSKIINSCCIFCDLSFASLSL